MSTHAKLAKAYLDQLCDRLDRGEKVSRPKQWWKLAVPAAVGASLGVVACSDGDTGSQSQHQEAIIDCGYLPDEPVGPLYAAPAPTLGETECHDDVDNDDDTLVDCDDPDCLLACSAVALYAAPAPTLAEDCGNELDDDLDGDVDCDDADCVDDINCSATALYAAPAPDPDAEVCDNCLDDDHDGAFDCADPDCADFPGCEALPEMNCHDGVDDDGDGLTDCADDDCLLECGAQPLYAAPAPVPDP